MPSMFSEADLDAFQRLRCAFDPDGLANPGKVMPTPRLCGEVPGPYREHPLERAGVADAVLMRVGARALPTRSRPGELRGGRRRAGGAAAAGRHPVRIVGGGTKLGWGAPASARHALELHTTGLDRTLEHNAGDLTAIFEAGVPLARAQARARRGRADAGARPAARPATRGVRGDDRRRLRDRRRGPLRHRYGARAT